MLQRKRIVLLVSLTLILFIVTPSTIIGLSDINQADTAWKNKDYAGSTSRYLLAVHIFPWRADLWEKAGVAASSNAKYSDAISYFKHVPNLSEQGWAALGLSYFEIGDSSSAALAYQKGLQVNESAELFAGLAMVYRSQKNWQAECAALKNQSRLNPGDAYVHYRLGILLAVLDPAHSLTELQAASELNPNADSAVKTVRAALNVSATQADPSQQMLTIGRGLGLVKEWDLAIAAFEKATVSDPKNADAWAWLGEAKQQLGQDGSKELDTALTLNPSSVIVHALRGLYWNRKSNYPKMLAEYTQAASIDPVNPAWQAEIGNAFANKGDLAAAFDAYQHAIELAPKDSTYWRLLAVFCAENNIHLEDAGLPAAKKAVELSPKDPNSLDALGWLYLATGRYANAEQVLKDTVTRFPDHLPAHIHLAMTYLAQGNRKDAFSELTFVHDADTLGGDGEAAGKLLARYFP